MSWTKRRRHLSRAQRAVLRAKAEQPPKIAPHTAPGRVPNLPPSPSEEVAHATPRRRDADCLVESTSYGMKDEDLGRYRDLLVAVLHHRPGLVDEPYLDCVRELTRIDWLREPAAWRPRGRGLGAGFRSLAAHLLGEYPVSPLLWDTLLIPEHGDRQPWAGTHRFVSLVARGFRVRQLTGTKTMPAPLTRRMVHLVVNPPRPMPLVALVRRAQVLAYGGTEALAAALPLAGLDGFQADEAYWATFIHWLCRQGQVPGEQIVDLLHYLRAMVREGATVDLKGRTVASLSREAARWRKLDDLRWRAYWERQAEDTVVTCAEPDRPPCAIADYEHGEWTLTRIRTARKLIIEGCVMHHCVGRYGDQLREGKCSFWSLACGGRRMLTIQVDQDTRCIEMVNGRANRAARPAEAVHVTAWARANGLAIDDECLPPTA